MPPSAVAVPRRTMGEVELGAPGLGPDAVRREIYRVMTAQGRRFVFEFLGMEDEGRRGEMLHHGCHEPSRQPGQQGDRKNTSDHVRSP